MTLLPLKATPLTMTCAGPAKSSPVSVRPKGAPTDAVTVMALSRGTKGVAVADWVAV